MSDDHHVLPKDTLFKVFGGLIVLTALTVGVAYVPLGPLGVPVAIGIAAAKATLVVLFFMALKYDNPVNALTFTIGIIMVVVFITFTMFDTAFRGDLGNVTPQTVQEIEREQEAAQQEMDQINPENLRVAPADYPDQQGAGGNSAEGGGDESQ
ncbi:oxidase [Salinibacter sp. 10B]|uniref:cytochrome C oxidase subunit IV family protein n=1 Tax=Salinibacter sp. 10B TaxID=1923971 RepID=UPI000CF44FE6|nr:cytochrome C oxidase subunit IV family protein [Salinibacter sp. 10B]PQJ35725.1 oxidase [Salinibacter sp. 10B]